MPTATSSRERAPRLRTGPGPVARSRRAVRDTGHLLRFRVATSRRPAAWRWVVGVLGGLLVALAVVPAYVPGAGSAGAADLQRFTPAALTAFLGVAIVTAIAAGGGRELLPREQAVSLPVSPATDHLGALVLAPLTIAWLLQAAALVGATAYVVGPSGLVAAQAVLAWWFLAATAVAQVLGWTVEYVRRGPGGPAIVRGATGVVVLAGVVAHARGHTTDLLASAPVRAVARAMDGTYDAHWALVCAVLALLTVAAVVLGAVPAAYALRRMPRDEQRLESARHAPRTDPRSAYAALVRVDRGSVWRLVPMRRGLAVLAVGPGAVAWAGALDWSQVLVMAGLVVAGALLLFGVNAWCLDQRGALWRESLPVAPSTVFAARAWVVAECLLGVAVVAVLLGGAGAGMPSAVEATALGATVVVVVVQATAAGMRWSLQRPYAVDLRSPRATPAPPGVMVGYSARLAASTTLTCLVFVALLESATWPVPLVVGACFAAWSLARLLRAWRRWLHPAARARVVTTVAA